ncbi:MAG: GNAT family N-acetyltransferase [Verrucomicrobia bacterium]|nr:GNAT family N-acetyltransferase [Verrucomicrobiota bacterium]
MSPAPPFPGAVIEPAGREDLPAIAALAGVVWRAYYPGIISEAQIDYMLARMYDRDVLRQELAAGIRYDRLLVRMELLGFASYGPAPMRAHAALGQPGPPEVAAGGNAETGVRVPGSEPLPASGDLKLHKLYVHPAWQRRGLGTQLLRHVEQTARAGGFRTLVLSVNKANAQAIAAYRKNGFTVREAIVTDIGGGFVMDDYVMAKAVR